MESKDPVVGEIQDSSHSPWRKSSTRGTKKDVGHVFRGHKHNIVEVKNGPVWSCGPILGDLGLSKFRQFLVNMILGKNNSWHG
eukprot:925245-Pelagomonas_calceolata.AAC.14